MRAVHPIIYIECKPIRDKSRKFPVFGNDINPCCNSSLRHDNDVINVQHSNKTRLDIEERRVECRALLQLLLLVAHC